MTRRPIRDVVGRRVTLSESGEGWFAGHAALSGTVESVIPSNEGDNPCYVVRFDLPLDLQEPGAATVSGLILRRYSHCVIRCRWQGVDVNVDEPVSVHVLLVPAGSDRPESMTELSAMTVSVWADCVVFTATGS